MTIERLVKAREDQYKPDGCKEYRTLERHYLDGFEYKYTKSEDIISELEDNDVDVSKYQTEENKIAEELHETTSIKAREDHLAVCDNPRCKEMREAKIEYDLENKK